MTYSQTDSRSVVSDRVGIALLATGIAFVMGYTVVRMSLTQSETQSAPTAANESLLTPVIPHQAALWSDVSGTDN